MATFEDEDEDNEKFAYNPPSRAASSVDDTYDSGPDEEESPQDTSSDSSGDSSASTSQGDDSSSSDDASSDQAIPLAANIGDKAAAPEQLAAAAPAPSAALAPAPADKLAAMKAYLEPKYDPDVQAAMAESKRQNMISNIGSALDTFATANAVAHGGRGSDQGFWQGIKDQGQQGVSDALKSFAQKNEVQNQVAKLAMEKGDFETRQKAAQFQNAQNDATSQNSKNAQASFAALFKNDPKYADIDLSTYSANDIAKLTSEAESKEKIEDSKSWRNMQYTNRKDMLADKKDEKDKQIAVNEQIAARKYLDSESATSRSGVGVANSKVNSAKRLLSFADVDPAELAAAKTDPQAKAALIQKLNKFSPQQYPELVTGVMTQISNGNGSLGQMEHLKANTYEETLAKVKQFFNSTPESANLGEIIYPLLLTLKNEADTSQKVLDEHGSKLRAIAPNAFTHPYTKASMEGLEQAFVNNAANPNSGPSAAAPVAGWAHPQAQDAKEWAMNPKTIAQAATDPKLAAKRADVLERLGIMNASNNIGGASSGSK